MTLNGAPVADASITFHPDGGDPEARSAGASTDANGGFKVTTLKPQDGIFPGNYKVTIVKYEEYGPEPPKVMNSEGEMVSAGRPVKNTLPAKYEKKEASELTVTMEKKKNTANFELTD